MPFKNRHSSLIIACFVLLFLCVFAIGNAEAKKPVPTDPPPPAETEAGTLSLEGFNIVTVHWDKSLRVWKDSGESPAPTWTIPDVPPSAVAIGDLDDNGLKEIIIHRACTYEEKAVTFINAYEGEDTSVLENATRNYIDSLHPWWTTYGSPVDYAGQGVSLYDQIIAANLDDDPGDEIILITASRVSIFDYVAGETNSWAQGPGTIRKIAEVSLAGYFPPVESGHVVAAAVGNVDGNSTPDIVITINILEKVYGTWDGYLLVWTDPWSDLEDDIDGDGERVDNISPPVKGYPTWGYDSGALQLSNMEYETYTKIWTVYADRKADTCKRGKTEYPCNIKYDSILSFWEKIPNDVYNPEDGWHWEERIVKKFYENSQMQTFIRIATGEIEEEYDGDEIVTQTGAPAGVGMGFAIYNASSLAGGLPNPFTTYFPELAVSVHKIVIHDNKIILGGMMQGDMTPFLKVVDLSDMSVNWELQGGLDYKTSNVSAEVDDFAVTGSLP